jgi:hypothetical protein
VVKSDRRDLSGRVARARRWIGEPIDLWARNRGSEAVATRSLARVVRVGNGVDAAVDGERRLTRTEGSRRQSNRKFERTNW